MSLAIWPPVGPAELESLRAETYQKIGINNKMLIDVRTGRKRRELIFIGSETLAILAEVKQGLDECYGLLAAAADPGSSTLAFSTPRNEAVKGFLTRVGTRIVKGTLHLQPRTLPALTVTVDPGRPIGIPPLEAVHAHLTRCVDLAALVLAAPAETVTPAGLAPQLRVLSHALVDSAAVLSGRAAAAAAATPSRPELPPPRPPLSSRSSSSSRSYGPSAAEWTRASAAASHFSPPLPANFSFHLSVRDSCLVLHLRVLEPADAPVNLGTKLGLAIGTVRRLEHDEMDTVFRFWPRPAAAASSGRDRDRDRERDRDRDGGDGSAEVYVREKIRIESADPCLMSLAAKLGSLSHTLAQARQNLADVLGEEVED